MFDIVTIGSATRDNFLILDYKLINSKESPSGKVIALPFGEKLGVDRVYFTLGGNSANAAVTFARQGFKTACAAKIGNDLPGQELLADLNKEGVNTSLISKSKDFPTAYSVLLLDKKTGERTILNNHGASDSFTIKDLNLKKMKAKWWYVSLAGEADKMYFDILDFARENKIKIAFNPSGHHIKHRSKDILKSLKNISFLVLNEGEAAELVGIPFQKEKKVFKKLDSLIPGIVAVTNGPKGVTVCDSSRIYKAGIFSEKKLVDRTGAGDAFGSGFVAGLMDKGEECKKNICKPENIAYAIRFASANATAVVEAVGATPGILTKERFQRETRWRDFKIQTISF